MDDENTLVMTFLINDKQFIEFISSNNYINIVIDMLNVVIDTVYDNNYDKWTNLEEPRYSEVFGLDFVYYITYNPGKLNPNLTKLNPNPNFTKLDKITKKILDTIYNIDLVSPEFNDNVSQWDLLPVDRSFDLLKIKEYLDTINDTKRKEIIEKIIENTQYITFGTLKETLIKQINRLPDKVNIYFNITGTKIGSESKIGIFASKVLNIGLL